MDIHPAIYLDNNATTPVDPEVVNEMLPYFLSAYGNPSSNDHILGWQAQEAVENTRNMIADAFQVEAQSIIYTSGATEAINLVLYGLLRSKAEPKHVITLVTEHKAVLETCKTLEKEGVEVTYLPVDKNGLVDLSLLTKSIKPSTALVCIMMVNNETGVIQPMTKIAEICHSQEVIFLSDTTQAIGKRELNTKKLGIDIIVGSAHKFYGPMGVGFLSIAETLKNKMHPLLTGGSQEAGKRAGTLNVPGIVGMGKALSVVLDGMAEETARIEALRNGFEEKLAAQLNITINGTNAPRVANTSSIIFHGVDSERLMQAIGAKVAASRGSACTSIRVEPSHVLTAIGLSADEANSSIRFSLGRYTSTAEINKAVNIIVDAANRLISA